jgi:hypothetical protein
MDEIIIDVAGQPGGPSPEEQARVDAEQREIMARIRAEGEAAAQAERDAGNDVASKVEKAARTRIYTADLKKEIDALTQRFTELEGKVNG